MVPGGPLGPMMGPVPGKEKEGVVQRLFDDEAVPAMTPPEDAPGDSGQSDEQDAGDEEAASTLE